MKVLNFQLNYIECVNDMKNGFNSPWKGGFGMKELKEMSEYLTDIEWIRCFNVFLKGECRRKYIMKEMHKTARWVKISLTSRTILLEYAEHL